MKLLRVKGIVLSIIILLTFSLLSLNSIADYLFPSYYLFLVIGIILFIFFSQIEFEILTIFSLPLFIISLILLILPILIGEITRGVIRWIPIGSFSVQPSEIVRPFLLLFAAHRLAQKPLKLKNYLTIGAILAIPLLLILLQPSLGVTLITAFSFFGVLLAIGIDRKMLLTGVLLAIALLPFSWFIMAPYQKDRVRSLLMANNDPLGGGYNSAQSMISVGSGRFWGKGLGEGIQTQLKFLPERHTDFIFASISEEWGFVGAFLLLLITLFLLSRLIYIIEHPLNLIARAFVVGVFFSIFIQVTIHIGMNMGLLPITGVPYPLVSAGGSSFIATMIMLGISVSACKYTS